MTDQVREILVYEGWETSLEHCPHIPFNDERIKRLDYDEIEDPGGIFFSTACWREYIGTWEIKDGRFYLNKIIGKYQIIDGLPIFADWFSGEVIVPRGDLLDSNMELGFKLTYEQELHLTIEQGIVTHSRLVDNRK